MKSNDKVALAEAYAALDAGDVERARRLGTEVLLAAESAANRSLQAHALLCLAQGDRLASRFRRAVDTSRRASRLFRSTEELGPEITALTILSHSSGMLGQTGDAVESGLLGVQLADALPDRLPSALTLSYLGVAYYWSRSFDQANDAFEKSIQMAALSLPPVGAVQSTIYQLWNEAMRLTFRRLDTGEMGSTEQLTKFMERCSSLMSGGCPTGILPGAQITIQAMFSLGCSIAQCWRGDLQGALQHMATGSMWVSRYTTSSWMSAAIEWVALEIAWAQEHWPDAEKHALAMIKRATSVEHEQMACLGHQLASQIFERQGKHLDAWDELRRLNRREQAIRQEGLTNRAESVKSQLEARKGEERLQTAEAASRQFQQMSLEDVLTRIANRRCFENRLAAMLHIQGNAVSVALLDVDRFKQVNDAFSHQVGDEVLKVVARILSRQIREGDLPARLGGDEFVVAFPRADPSLAKQICVRIAESVAAFDWATVADGLRVSVSVGVAQAQDADTVATLLHRSDVAMYEAKALTRYLASPA